MVGGLGGEGSTELISGSHARTNDDYRQRLTLSSQATVYGGRLWGASHQLKVGLSVENERYFRTLTQRATATRQDFCVPLGLPSHPGLDHCVANGSFNMAVPETDDVRTTGNSLTSAARLLRRLRPRHLVAAVVAVADEPSRRTGRAP